LQDNGASAGSTAAGPFANGPYGLGSASSTDPVRVRLHLTPCIVDLDMRRLALLILVCTLAAFATACGGGSKQSVLDTKSTSETTSEPTPRPRGTPTQVPTPLGPPGRVTTSVQAVCRLGITDAVVYVTYRAEAAGNTVLRGVRLMINNKLADESGDIYDTSFEKNAIIHVSPGKQYTFSVTVTAPNALAAQFANVVRCPQNAGPGA
jgi:hypothetical protein